MDLEDHLTLLACPIDKGPLVWLPEESAFHNPRLDRRYPVVDGIPRFLTSDTDGPAARSFGLEAGSVYPAENASALLNPLRRIVQSPRRTVDAIQLPPDATVLELGSGPGYFSPSLSKVVSHGQLVLFDLQFEMLRRARQRLDGHANVGYVQGDGSELPFAADSFTAVFIAVVLGEIPDKDTALAEVRRILAPNGIVAISETRRDSDFIPLPQLQELLARQNLTFVDRRGSRHQYLARFAETGGR